jgi:CRP-like cAMP-binding protein
LRSPQFLLIWLCPCCFCHLFLSLTGDFRPEIGSRAMSKPIEQDVSVLSSSKHGLVYLTANDWALVADKANRVLFKKGEVLVQKGKKANGVYLLLKGNARVQIPLQATVPVIGPGEICGEMSFLEDGPASASVVAEGEVEAYHLDPPTLQGLFELFPHLASRFYRSLAMNLSRRLRDMIGSNSGQAPPRAKPAL